MKTIRTSVIVLIALIICFEVYVNLSAWQLPERMASHFTSTGKADDFMSRDRWTAVMRVVGPLVAGMFALLAIVLPYFPDRFVNLPDRAYWLAPERRKHTFALISDTVLWSGCLMVLLFCGIQYLTIRANRLEPPRLEAVPFIIVMGGFLLAHVVLVIRLLRRFATKGEA